MAVGSAMTSTNMSLIRTKNGRNGVVMMVGEILGGPEAQGETAGMTETGTATETMAAETVAAMEVQILHNLSFPIGLLVVTSLRFT